MADFTTLKGYLMKEKSKTSLLHGITGDINKRYFRVQKIEAGDELALCYYKNMNDSEVRGWIYLKDMIEIAEKNDTMIFASVARTLRLYAETRADHNTWVTGLANLCPDAFVKLQRNAPLLKQNNDKPLIETGDRLDIADKARSPEENEKPNKLTTVGAEESSAVDSGSDGLDDDDDDTVTAELVSDDCSSRSTSENVHNRPSQKEPEHPKSRKVEQASPSGRKRAADSSEVSIREARSRTRDSRDQKSETANEGRTDIVSERITEPDSQSRRQGVSPTGTDSARLALPETQSDAEMTSDQSADASTNRQRRERSEAHLEHEAGTNSGTHDCPHVQSFVIPGSQHIRSHSEGDIGHDFDGKKKTTSPDLEVPPREPLEDALTGQAGDRTLHGDDEDEDDGTINLDESHEVSRGQCESEHEDRIETTVAKVQFESVLGEEHKHSNQDEELESDQCAGIATWTPPIDLTWEGGLRQGKTATSRLHRHILQDDGAYFDVDPDALLPPKEFLSSQPSQEQCTARKDREDRPNAKTNNRRGLTPSVHESRRRSAADLDWSGEEEATEGRLSRTEDKLAAPASTGPVEVSDSEDDAACNLDLEIEKQRRRATAAIQALEAAAKEADAERMEHPCAAGGGQEDRNHDRSKSSNWMDTEPRKFRKRVTVPAPIGPPPPGSTGKTRRGHEVPPPRMPPPQLAPPSRSRHPNRRANPDENFVNDNWDDEVKAETDNRMSPVSAWGSGAVQWDSPARGTPVSLLDSNVSNKAAHWRHFED